MPLISAMCPPVSSWRIGMSLSAITWVVCSAGRRLRVTFDGALLAVAQQTQPHLRARRPCSPMLAMKRSLFDLHAVERDDDVAGDNAAAGPPSRGLVTRTPRGASQPSLSASSLVMSCRSAPR